MTARQNGATSYLSWGLMALMVVVLGVAAYVVVKVLSDDSPRRKSNATTVTLVRPPPPAVKEKLPEPEPQPVKNLPQKEEMVDPGAGAGPSNEPQQADNSAPAGDRLSMDSDGSAGSDAFGIAAKRGGRDILSGGGQSSGSGTGSGGGGGVLIGKGGGGGLNKLSLLTRFGWYTQIVETEIRKKVMKQIDEGGGIPRGKFQTIARVSVDAQGAIVDSRIIGSSGNHKMDEAVQQSLEGVKISEPPPDGMPRTMNIRISSQS